MKLDEIATKILVHLKRFEADKKINKVVKKEGGMSLSPYYNVNCWATGKQVHVTYISFQGDNALNKTQALVYLMWLDDGNVGKHSLCMEKVIEKLK